MKDVDLRNTERMKEIVAEHGWPTKTLVGSDGSRAAWLLVQHADHDVAFQGTCLLLMKRMLEARQVEGPDVAYLTDRVMVNIGRPQVYGTQFHVQDSNRQPRPIRDAKGVDDRRRAMGLNTLKEYTEFMNS